MTNTEIAKSLYAAWENNDLNKAASILSDSFVLTGPAPVPLNKDAYLTFQSVHNTGFSNWSFNARDFRENGNTVVCMCRISATHTGVYDVSRLGLPVPPVQPTGITPIWAEERMTFTISGGKITALVVEQLGEGAGVVGTLRQLGVALPASPAG